MKKHTLPVGSGVGPRFWNAGRVSLLLSVASIVRVCDPFLSCPENLSFLGALSTLAELCESPPEDSRTPSASPGHCIAAFQALDSSRTEGTCK